PDNPALHCRGHPGWLGMNHPYTRGAISMRLGFAVVLATALMLGTSDRASAQVIYYNTPIYYTSPYTPFVRTYSMPVMYSTYTSPIVVPTRFVSPPWGTVAYDYPPIAAGRPHPPGYVQPYPAFRQIGYSTYTNAPVPIGGVYYSGDAYIPPSSYYYTPYPELG